MAKRKGLEKGAKKSAGRPKAGTRHPFLQFGPVYQALHDWRVVLSRDPMYLNITQKMIDTAIPGSPKFCVMALAVRAFWGKTYDFQVGKGVLKIWDFVNKIELRCHVPSTLSRAAGIFDTEKVWPLPPNVYRLNPMTPILRNRKRAEEKRQKHALGKWGKLHIENNRGFDVRRKPKKTKRAAATRTVLRNTRIKWNGATLIKK